MHSFIPRLLALLSVAIMSALSVGACGFSPVYEEKSGDASSRELLRNISVDAPHSRDGQVFQRELLALLRGKIEQPTDPEYRLEVRFKQDEIPLHIRRNRIVTRFRVHMTAEYKLRRVLDNAVIEAGELTRTGGYDRVESDYSTHVSKRELTERLIKALAQDCRRRLAVASVSSE